MKTKRLSVLAALVTAMFAVFTLQSCQEKSKPVDPSQLEGYWVLKTLNDQDAKTLFDGALPTIQFDFEKMTVFGTGGCNNYSGAFTYQNAMFNAPDLATTKMLCAGKSEEGMFWVELARPSTLSVDNGMLSFKADGKELTLVFDKGEAPKTFNERLTGTWTLNKMSEKPVSDFFKGKEAKIPTLVFNFDEKKINGNSGCNNFFTAFKIDNGLLIVSPIASTMMACPNMEGETQYTNFLADTSGINLIDDNNLQLIKKGNIVLEFTKNNQ